jgi:hypothetical protein
MQLLGYWCALGLLSYLLILRFFPPALRATEDSTDQAPTHAAPTRQPPGPILKILDLPVTAVAIPIVVLVILVASPIFLVACTLHTMRHRTSSTDEQA